MLAEIRRSKDRNACNSLPEMRQFTERAGVKVSSLTCISSVCLDSSSSLVFGSEVVHSSKMFDHREATGEKNLVHFVSILALFGNLA